MTLSKRDFGRILAIQQCVDGIISDHKVLNPEDDITAALIRITADCEEIIEKYLQTNKI